MVFDAVVAVPHLVLMALARYITIRRVRYSTPEITRRVISAINWRSDNFFCNFLTSYDFKVVSDIVFFAVVAEVTLTRTECFTWYNSKLCLHNSTPDLLIIFKSLWCD